MRKLVSIIVAAAIVIFAAASSPAAGRYTRPTSEAPAPVDEALVARINDIYVIHFILDGTNLRAFDQAIADGRMPTLEERILKRGARFTQATSAFPSTSTTVYQSFASGLLPGHAGIPHLERFDRIDERPIAYLAAGGPAALNSDFINLRALLSPDEGNLTAPTTIFDLLRGHPTAAIYSSFFRGAAIVHPEQAPIHALWSTYVTDSAQKVDVLAFREVLGLFRSDAIPRYAHVGLYSSDIIGHHFGPESPEVADVLKQFDLFLAEFFALLEERGIADKTYVIVSADHGMHESGELFGLQKELEAAGVAVRSESPRKKDFTLYAANRGVSSSHVYVRHDGGFAPITDPELLRRHPKIGGGSVDLVELILGMEATDLLVIRAGERRARIHGHDGLQADIACYPMRGVDYCSYRFDRARGDPLGYASNRELAPLLDGRPHSTFAWRAATAGERYPDAVIELAQIFHDGRAGDAFITTRERFGFRKVKAGNHGGPLENDMRVPLVIAGPSVPHGNFGAARSVDLYPLLIEWFGLGTTRGTSDGVNPFAAPAGDEALAAKLAAVEQAFDGKPPLMKMIDVPAFVRKDVHPVVAAAEFARLKPLAEEEAHLRSRQLAKVRGVLKALEREASREDAPRVAPDGYLADHTAIVKRAKAWLEGSLTRMEDVATVLDRCRDAYSSQCRAL